MTGGATTYNERSWAIDLIGHLKHLSRNAHRRVQDAGGEHTIKGDASSLFPDVLLFGDRADGLVLQGWELKMPDTGIDEQEFRGNAEVKARKLGLDSFVLWNVSSARLYALNAETDTFSMIEKWDELSDITSRGDVKPAQDRWEAVASSILNRVNELLETGELEGRRFVEAYRSGGPTSLVLANSDAVAAALERAARRDFKLKSSITLWWNRYSVEYGGKPYQALAQANLVNWIGKLLFAHILRERDSRAGAVKGIGDDTTPAQALALFKDMSRACNFWTIFCDGLGLSALPEVAWSHLRQFNNLLSDLNVGGVDQAQLSEILEATASVGSRKLRGQYTTPLPLARLLVRLSVRDAEGRVLDPCCGSGTIARASLELKLNSGVNAADAAAGIFAGDLDPQASQLATFALAKPSMMSHPLRLFIDDAFKLSPSTEIPLRDPNDGTAFVERLGTFHAITSNLPFVAQVGRKQYGDAIAGVNEMFEDNFTGRADVAAYLPFALHKLLEPGGRLGIIITNAWLGTAWGDAFRRRLGEFYRLKAVIASGAGRWFQNSKVVTNILILEKPKDGDAEAADEGTHFVVLKRPINTVADEEAVELTAAQIEHGQTHDETLTVRSVTRAVLEEFATLGLAGNAQFVDVSWVRDLPLVPVRSLFDVRRGERRGWDRMFYPAAGHEIESDYIRPVLMSSSGVKGYVTTARREAFSCSVTVEELKRKGHTGALGWIERFAGGVNKKARPLPEALDRPGRHWYEMRADERTELFASINYGNRLYVGRLTPPAFVNQRLVRLIPKAGHAVNIDLCHALLNSTVSLFMLEGMGFGRGQGALDLNKDRIEDFMHMLDPAALTGEQTAAVLAAFEPLRKRRIMEVADELEQNDRRAFDTAVLEVFGHGGMLDRIYKSLLNLVAIRQTARS